MSKVLIAVHHLLDRKGRDKKLLQFSRSDPKERLKSQTIAHLSHCARELWPQVNKGITRKERVR